MLKDRRATSKSHFAGAMRLPADLILAGIFLFLTSTSAFSADQAPGAKVVPDLEAACRPDAVQAAAAKLSSAVVVKEISDGPKLPGGTKFTGATKELPAYCQVTGSFVTNPKTGKTANFLATFPATWNGKYLQMGCSSHCGAFPVNNAATPIVTVTNQGYPGEIIIKGYASFSTDEGHEGDDRAKWAIKGPGQLDEDAVEDFYYRADQVLARLGKQFTTAFYGQAIKSPQKISYAYFSGCSGGGRDAFVTASYFPEEFDGIIGGSAYSNMMAVAFQRAGTTLASILSEDADVPLALVTQVDRYVKAKCDKLDGVEDGLIQNPAACDFSAGAGPPAMRRQDGPHAVLHTGTDRNHQHAVDGGHR